MLGFMYVNMNFVLLSIFNYFVLPARIHSIPLNSNALFLVDRSFVSPLFPSFVIAAIVIVLLGFDL